MLLARCTPTLDRDHVIATLTSHDPLTSLGDHHVATDTVAFLAPAAARTNTCCWSTKHKAPPVMLTLTSPAWLILGVARIGCCSHAS